MEKPIKPKRKNYDSNVSYEIDMEKYHEEYLNYRRQRNVNRRWEKYLTKI